MIGQLERIVELKNLKKKDKTDKKSNVITVSSGKGGTGKTVISSNLAYYLSSQNYKVLLIDLDFNMGNVAPLFDLITDNSLLSFLSGNALFSQVLFEVNENLHLIAGDSGASEYPLITNEVISRLQINIEKLSDSYDFIILDSASGIEKHTLDLNIIADLSLLICTPEPTAVMDAYAVIKAMNISGIKNKTAIITNKCINNDDNTIAFNNLNEASKKFLNTSLLNSGSISFSVDIHKSILEQNILARNNKNSGFIDELSLVARNLIKFTQVANNLQSSNQAIS